MKIYLYYSKLILLSLFSSVCGIKNNIQNVKDLALSPSWLTMKCGLADFVLLRILVLLNVSETYAKIIRELLIFGGFIC